MRPRARRFEVSRTGWNITLAGEDRAHATGTSLLMREFALDFLPTPQLLTLLEKAVPGPQNNFRRGRGRAGRDWCAAATMSMAGVYCRRDEHETETRRFAFVRTTQSVFVVGGVRAAPSEAVTIRAAEGESAQRGHHGHANRRASRFASRSGVFATS
jgi:hypothetical protein